MHEYERQWLRATGHGVRHPLRLKMERLQSWCDTITARTSVLYFSPKSIMAPTSCAWSLVILQARTGMSFKI